MKSATYGRMRTGRCITAEEVAAQKRQLAGEDIRLLGCSADVLETLDRRCSGNAECNIRVSDIQDENIQPCFPGLKMYLETSYDCVISKSFTDNRYFFHNAGNLSFITIGIITRQLFVVSST